jgi:hypothetical protein
MNTLFKYITSVCADDRARRDRDYEHMHITAKTNAMLNLLSQFPTYKQCWRIVENKNCSLAERIEALQVCKQFWKQYDFLIDRYGTVTNIQAAKKLKESYEKFVILGKSLETDEEEKQSEVYTLSRI